MSDGFRRGLSDAFVADLLGGVTAPVLEACRRAGLDVRLRDDYLNAYDGGRSVARLAWARGRPRLVIHSKYVSPGAFPGVPRTVRGAYVEIEVTRSVAERFGEELAAVRLAAEGHAGTEERDELRFLGDNACDTPLACVDRQVQVPGQRRRLDVAAVTTAGEPALVLVELKRDLDNRIQEVPLQVGAYLDVFAPGGGLRGDIAASLARVASQLRALGFAAPPADRFAAGMRVVGLVVLVRYEPRSKLLERAHAAARGLEHPVWLWMPGGDGSLRVPPPAEWVRMG